MEKLNMKKTLNLHKYSIRVNRIILNWKLILPVIFTILGIVLGSVFAKGEGEVYLKLCNFIEAYVLNKNSGFNYTEFSVYLLIPTVFALILFFSGLSAFGGWFSNLIPLAFSATTSIITYFIYDTYSLKGLAYNVIMIFPYALLSILSLILLTSESISMSQCITHNLSKSTRNNDYNFFKYCKNCTKCYILIVSASLIKILLDSMFTDLFIF